MKSPRVEIIMGGSLSYQNALALQDSLSREARTGFLLFSPPPTITLGKRSLESDVKLSREVLERLKITRLDVDRGGEVTFHGPGQIVGFPFGTLESHTGDPRGVKKFVHSLKKTLEKFISIHIERQRSSQEALVSRTVDPRTSEDCAGVWTLWSSEKLETPENRLLNCAVAPRSSEVHTNERRKIVSIGMSFGRFGVRHGFAINIQPSTRESFSFIHPCGERSGASVDTLFLNEASKDEFERACALLGQLLQSI